MPTTVKVHARTVNRAKGFGVVIQTQPSVLEKTKGKIIATCDLGPDNPFNTQNFVAAYGVNREAAIKRVLRKLGYNG